MIRAGFCNISFARPEPAKLRPWRQFFYFCSTRRILLLDCLRSILPGRCPNWTRSGPVIDLPRILRTCCSCAALSGSWAPARRADPPADLRSWPGSSPGRAAGPLWASNAIQAGHGPGCISPALLDALTAPGGPLNLLNGIGLMFNNRFNGKSAFNLNVFTAPFKPVDKLYT